MGNFTYLVAADAKDGCVAIDPSWDMKAISDAAAAEGMDIKAALLTHGHFDHSKKIDKLAASVPVYIEGKDLPFLEADPKLFKTFSGNSALTLAGMYVRALHTPGHSPGSVCYLIDDALFSGDTLFVGEVGRVDLPGSDVNEMYKSMLALAALPPETKVYPGHGYGDKDVSTIAEQKLQNPYLKMALKDREDFLSAMR
jgi:glyoxylase-like metal-dependent hydrolase (beta-lactamase superfamily II)